MHEHGCEDGQKISAGISKEAAGDKGPLLNKRITAAHFYEEEQDVQSEQGISDQRKNSARGIIVTDGKHNDLTPLLYTRAACFNCRIMVKPQTHFSFHSFLHVNVLINQPF
jgi:hypothetical protein